MRTTITDLANWPVRRNGQPIFNSTQEAYLYAQLIWDDPKIIEDLSGYRSDTLVNLKYERSQKHPNLNTMMDLACRAQFFRECLEEVERIGKEPPTS
jgi:hypothetical protein